MTVKPKPDPAYLATLSERTRLYIAELEAKVEQMRRIIDGMASGRIRTLYGWAGTKMGYWATSQLPSDMTANDGSWVGPFDEACQAIEAAEAAKEGK